MTEQRTKALSSPRAAAWMQRRAAAGWRRFDLLLPAEDYQMFLAIAAVATSDAARHCST